ncbi:MAG: Brp/Blh family beta-carotene 15,15'-dioxygenase [Marinobacter adhaerens]
MSDYAPGSVGFRLHQSREGKSHQAALIVALVVVIGIAMVLPPLSIEHQFWLIIIPVGVFGVSHGGADPWIVRRLTGAKQSHQTAVLMVYVLASAIFLGLVWLSPVTALLVFLTVSIWHFGFTDEAYLSRDHSKTLLWLSGSTPVVGPMLGHPDQTAELFAWLIAHDAPAVIEVVTFAGPVLALLWLIGLGALILRKSQSLSGGAFSELILVAIALVLLPPLLAFTFYFCLVHTVRHFISIAQTSFIDQSIPKQIASLARKVWPATLAAIALALAGWLLLLFWQPESELLIQSVRVLFWGLAALTLPHCLLVYLWWHKGNFS